MQIFQTKNRFSFFFVFTLVVLFALVWQFDQKIKEHQDFENRELLTLSVESLETVFEEEKNTYIHHTEFVTRDKQILQIAKDYAAKKISWKQVNKLVEEDLMEHINGYEFKGYFLINKDGFSIASSRASNVGTKNLLAKHESIWKKIQEGNSLITAPIPSDVPISTREDEHPASRFSTSFVVAPIKANGQVLMYLAFRLFPEKIYWKHLLHQRLGVTGEAYIVDRSGILLSPSRFVDMLPKYIDNYSLGKEVFGISIPKIEEGKSPLKSKDEENVNYRLTAYPDYRGTPVIGAWKWIKDSELGIVVERDHAEAYSYYQNIKIFLWLSYLFLAMILGALYYVVSKSFTKVETTLNTMTEHMSEIDATLMKYNPLDNFKILSVNAHFTRWTGMKKEEIIGQSFLDFVHPEDHVNYKKNVSHHLIDKKPFEHEYTIVFGDKTSCVKERGQILDNSGKVEVDTFITDITERKKMQSRLVNQLTLSSVFQILLKKSGQFNSNQELFDFAVDLLVDYEIAGIHSGSVYEINENKELQVTTVIGEDPDEIEGFFSRWEDSVRLKSQVSMNQPVIENTDTDQQELYIPLVLNKKPIGIMKLNKVQDQEFDSQIVQFLMSFAQIIGEITHRIHLDHELAKERENSVKVERLGAVGEISDALAHELNNPLMIIKGMTKLMKRSIEKERYERLSKTLKDVDKATDRISTLVASLRLFNRNHHVQVEQIDFKKFFTSVAIEGSIVAEKNEILLTYENQLDGCLYADKDELHFVLMKYITECCNVVRTQDKREIKIVSSMDGDRLRLEIQNLHPPAVDEIMKNKEGDTVVEEKLEGLDLWKNVIELNKGSVEYINGHVEFGFVLHFLFDEPLKDKEAA